MRIRITKGAAWYEDIVGHEFEVYEVSEVGYSDCPEIGYTVDPIRANGWQRFVSEFHCEVIEN